MFYLTVTRHSSSLRHRLLRLSEPSPQRRLSSLSIRSCRRHKHKRLCELTLTHVILVIDYTFISLLSSPNNIPHLPSSFAQPCQTPWACWWCRSQTLICSSDEPLGKVRRVSGKGGTRAQRLNTQQETKFTLRQAKITWPQSQSY